jgi:hypothetical protein
VSPKQRRAEHNIEQDNHDFAENDGKMKTAASKDDNDDGRNDTQCNEQG